MWGDEGRAKMKAMSSFFFTERNSAAYRPSFHGKCSYLCCTEMAVRGGEPFSRTPDGLIFLLSCKMKLHLKSCRWHGTDWRVPRSVLNSFTALRAFGQYLHINPEYRQVTVIWSVWDDAVHDPMDFETLCFLEGLTGFLQFRF